MRGGTHRRIKNTRTNCTSCRQQRQKEREYKSVATGNGEFSACNHLPKICGYMIGIWFSIYLVFHKENSTSLVSNVETKEHNLHAVTLQHVKVINRMIKVYRVVCLLSLQNWKAFSSRALPASSTVPKCLGSTADYFSSL